MRRYGWGLVLLVSGSVVVMAASPEESFKKAKELFEANKVEESVFWFLEAAEQGHVVSQLALGQMYSTGKGVPQSDEKAVPWYRKAADKGDAEAQFTLGYNYNQGKGVPKSDVKSLYWTRKAAEQGHAEAQFNLGHLYKTGRGVPKSSKKALLWFRKAAEQGYQDAKIALDLHDAIQALEETNAGFDELMKKLEEKGLLKKEPPK